ncbi:MAG: glycoside hydrolase family 2 TIM barrel-domain containing protein [Rikenellaceae bacterium]
MKRANIFRLLLLVAVVFATSISQLAARTTYPMMNDWRIFASAEGSGDRARNISLPYSWSLENNTPVSLTSTNFLRTLYAPNSWRLNRVFIKFGGVNSVADLIINGRYVGEHRGGATAFTFEITPFLDYGESNIIILRVSSAPRNDVLPTSVEHEVYGGIYRDVELIVTPKSAISPTFYGSDGVFVTTNSVDGGTAKGTVRVHFTTPASVERRLELSIKNDRGTEVFNKVMAKAKIENNGSIEIPFQVAKADLWSPEKPALYDVTVRLSSVDTGKGSVEAESDEVSVKTGFRIITLAKDGTAKGAVRVNGKPTIMNGVTLFHDHPLSGSSLSPRSIRSDMEIIKDLGANAIHSAVIPHSSYFYSMCDSLGVMAWVDTPLSRSPYLSDIGYFPTVRFEENGLQQLREIIYQNYNHPSVAMWGIFSLLSTRGDDPTTYVKKLNTEAKKIDKSRPTVALSDQNGDINSVCDLIVWRQNIGWENGLLGDVKTWATQIHSKWGHLRSGVLYGRGGSVYHQIDRSEIATTRAQKRDGWFPESRQSEMHEEYTKHLATDSLFWGTWQSTLFDFKAPRNLLGENVEGLVSFDRRSYKDAYYLYRALWNKKSPTLHIADRRARMLGAGDNEITLRVYASDESTPIIADVDGKKSEMKKVGPSQFQLEGVKVTKSTKVVVTQGKLSDTVEFIYDSPLRNQER